MEKLEQHLSYLDAENALLHVLLNAAFVREDACA
jgi:hypothetical protein